MSAIVKKPDADRHMALCEYSHGKDDSAADNSVQSLELFYNRQLFLYNAQIMSNGPPCPPKRVWSTADQTHNRGLLPCLVVCLGQRVLPPVLLPLIEEYAIRTGSEYQMFRIMTARELTAFHAHVTDTTALLASDIDHEEFKDAASEQFWHPAVPVVIRSFCVVASIICIEPVMPLIMAVSGSSGKWDDTWFVVTTAFTSMRAFSKWWARVHIVDVLSLCGVREFRDALGRQWRAHSNTKTFETRDILARTRYIICPDLTPLVRRDSCPFRVHARVTVHGGVGDTVDAHVNLLWTRSRGPRDGLLKSGCVQFD